MNCEGCQLSLNEDKSMSCHNCNGAYHFECLNMKLEQFQSFSKQFRSNWTCPACTNVTRRVRSNLNTPVRHNQVPSVENSLDMSCEVMTRGESPCGTQSETVSMDKFNELIHTLNAWRNDMNSNMISIREDIRSSLSEIHSEIKTIRREHVALKQNIADINNEITSLQSAMQFQSDDHKSLKKRVDELACDTCLCMYYV